MKIRELNDIVFDNRAKALVREYSQLVRDGFPEDRMERWNSKIDELPPIARETILSLVEINPYLKDALSNQGDFQSK